MPGRHAIDSSSFLSLRLIALCMIPNDKDGESCLLRAEAIRIVLCVHFQKVTLGAVYQEVRPCRDLGMMLSAERFLQWSKWTVIVSSSKLR